MFAFFTVDITVDRLPLQQCQMLASLAQRYSLALRGMGNFVTPLHSLCGFDLTSTPQNRHSLRRMSSQARLAIEMWRMAAVSLFVDPMLLAVPITSLCRLVTLPPHYYVISDAGPVKFGYAVYDSAGTLLWYSALAWPFKRNDVIQNAKEFFAFLVALVDLVLFVDFPKGCHIHWTGDNTSALKWVDENRCKSNFAQRAFIAFTFLCLRFQIEVVGVTHRPGYLSDGGD
jgi:hypothetical protein